MFADQIHDVFLADLDADGRDELVIADRLAVSNGIAATWAYVLGRWFRYAGGQLVSEPGALARRYLSSFARERASDVPGAPYAWFVEEKGV